jgi:hypothetical protein
MNDLEQVLENCLKRLTEGRSTVEECLSSYPEHAAQLEPLLQNASGLMQARREIHVSPIFKSRGRAKLTLHMLDHPQQRSRRAFPFAWRHFAVTTAVLMLALLSAGTVRAQSALPGDLFYSWKITSERLWRGISSDEGHVDLILAERRIREIVATADDPDHRNRNRAMHGYEEVLIRLQSGGKVDSEGEILSTLQSNQKSLKDAGLVVPQLDEYLGPRGQDNNTRPELPHVSPDVEIPDLIP